MRNYNEITQGGVSGPPLRWETIAENVMVLILDKLVKKELLYPLRRDMAYRPKNTQERILHRMKISKGHLEKVMKMTGEDTYCIDILHQLDAVQKGLKQIEDLILENHLKGCVSEAIKKGKKEKVIKEVMEVFKKYRE
jgi:CsoR family transcriptional regulator, copper-sensing transcriptional repressor